MWVDLKEARRRRRWIIVPVAALAQAWRGGSRAPRLALALDGTEAASFDLVSRAAGELCGNAGTADVIDASVVLVAARGDVEVLYTSDVDDLARLLEATGGDRPLLIAC